MQTVLLQGAVPAESRAVMLEGGRPTPGFAHNGIKTSKYNPVTFLPIFLFEMFSRAAYLYFLIQVPPSVRSIPTSTCLPIFLFEVLPRAAYLYLLMQVQYCLQFILLCFVTIRFVV